MKYEKTERQANITLGLGIILAVVSIVLVCIMKTHLLPLGIMGGIGIILIMPCSMVLVFKAHNEKVDEMIYNWDNYMAHKESRRNK